MSKKAITTAEYTREFLELVEKAVLELLAEHGYTPDSFLGDLSLVLLLEMIDLRK